MIRTVLTLRAAPERVEAILDFYRREQILQESLDLTRAVASEISVAADGSGEVIVTALWPDERAYQEWLDHPARERTGPALRELLEGVEVGAGKVFEIDHGVSKHDA